MSPWLHAQASDAGGWKRGLASLVATRTFQQAAVFVAAALAVGGIVMWLTLSRTSDVISRQVIETMLVEADGIAAVADSAGPAAAIEFVARKARTADLQLYLLTTSAGSKLAGNLNRWPANLAHPGPQAGERTIGATFDYERPDKTGPRLAAGVARRLPSDMELLVARDLQAQTDLALMLRWLYLAGFGALAFAGLAAGLLGSRLALARVREVARTSDQIMSGDLSRRVPITGTGDELDRLAQNVNTMLDRIESLIAGLREVSDNIAHDLKTPLTRLRSRAEDALRDGEPKRAREGLGRVIEDADELIKTFNALLLIARLEAGALEGSTETFDLAELVRDVAELYEPVAEESGMTIACTASEPVTVQANRQLVGQAIANLIDNAIKYGRQGDRSGQKVAGPDIAVDLASTGSEVRIAVADRGPGISAPDRERVLKRFVRLEASRTRPGTGLGLSLVAAVARLHGGRIVLEDNAPGLRTVLVLPKTDAPITARGRRETIETAQG